MIIQTDGWSGYSIIITSPSIIIISILEILVLLKLVMEGSYVS